ncbi:MAG TPA: type II toxin-antitoxin system PemK/MazF family toxin [Ghiorsea sp.]|nr:type II toxin-antitoxin system PemK/MazF family toxin [Ghiorsea sp.]HIP06981.1 type II toxin-antitoxin system PemK/MazF family toxin [Mariprofundaceae bacterium]
MVIKQYAVYLVNFDPTLGSEIRKVRPCFLVSPDEMNQNLRTVQIVPLTSNTRAYPWRVAVKFQNKKGTLAVDQIRMIDKSRIIKHMGCLKTKEIQAFKHVLQQMLID